MPRPRPPSSPGQRVSRDTWPCQCPAGPAACCPSSTQHLKGRGSSAQLSEGRRLSQGPRAGYWNPGQAQTSWSVPAPGGVAVAVRGQRWKTGQPQRDHRGLEGRGGEAIRTEIFVPFLVPNIEWIKICKTGGLLGPQPRTPVSPPTPRVTKERPDLACWTRAPALGEQPPGAVREMGGRGAPPPSPPAAASRPRALPDRVLGASPPERALSNVQGRSPSDSKQDGSCNIPGPGATWGAGRARGPGMGGRPCRQGGGGAGGGGVSCRPAAGARARCSCGGPRA